MQKFSCTRMSVGDIIYATLIAESEAEAKEMAVAAANERGRSGGRPRHWSVAVLESDVEGPARVLDCGHREA